ncbi:MAG: hypothetical protein AAFR65_11805 [Pseudomonadota bacterium]
MVGLVNHIRANGIFYVLVMSYGYLIYNMPSALWFGDGVNIFATYSDAQGLSEVVLDANKVYWSKTCFLFLTLLLLALSFDFRAAAGIGAVFWASSLILMFGASTTLIGVLILGGLLILQQVLKGKVFAQRES